MYRVLCLKDARDFLDVKPTEKICFALMNITKTLAEDIAISKFQNTVQLSPWFMQRGTLSQKNNMPYWIPPDPVDIIIGSQSSHIIGQAIYFAFFDEISFIRNQDIDKQKKIAIDMIDTAIGGMKTRFLKNGNNPTLLILASSKRSEKSFLEEHMKKKLSDEGAAKTTLIVDEPVWNIRPASNYCGTKFQVGLGNKYLPSEILPENADISDWMNRGYKIIDVPIEFKSEFLDNIDRALCDFAGISSTELTKYISGARLAIIKHRDIKNLFMKDLIETGNSAEDKIQYFDFVNLDNLDSKLKSRPLYIHLDMSLSGDKTGIAGVWILGKRPGTNSDAKELYYQVAFSFSVKAPKGYQVSFAKNRRFIYWLKEQGFNIKGISSDTYARAGIEQDLLSRGYKYSIISVDRCNTEHICEPYAYLKNTIYEERLILYDKCDLLTEELLGLERDGSTGKIDHPEHGTYGGKDQADAICGALWNASLHADEYSYEYGENLATIIDSNFEYSEGMNKQQLTVNFEEELKKTFESESSRQLRESTNEHDIEVFKDFGMGKATTNYNPMYVINGILF